MKIKGLEIVIVAVVETVAVVEVVAVVLDFVKY
jgi:hypothetical protein